MQQTWICALMVFAGLHLEPQTTPWTPVLVDASEWTFLTGWHRGSQKVFDNRVMAAYLNNHCSYHHET